MSASRGADGRWIKAYTETEGQQERFATPAPRRIVPSQATASEDKFSLDHLLGTWIAKARRPSEGEPTAKWVHACVLTIYWLVSLLVVATRLIFWVIFFLLFRSLLRDNTLALLAATARSCFEGGELSCYAKFQQAFYSQEATAACPRLMLQISEEDRANSATLYELAVSLCFGHLAFLFVAAIVTGTAWLLLSCAQRLMSETLRITSVASRSATIAVAPPETPQYHRRRSTARNQLAAH